MITSPLVLPLKLLLVQKAFRFYRYHYSCLFVLIRLYPGFHFFNFLIPLAFQFQNMPKAYLIEDIKTAVQSVKTARLTLSQAAREYGIPRQTLSDHVNKGLQYTPGRERMLNDQEEQALVNYSTYMASHGFPLSRKRARCYVMEIVKLSGRPSLFNIDKGPSDEWFRKFISRHPELSEKKAEKQDRSRNRMSNINVVDKFYDFFKKEMDKLGDVPAECIFNCDETG